MQNMKILQLKHQQQHNYKSQKQKSESCIRPIKTIIAKLKNKPKIYPTQALPHITPSNPNASTTLLMQQKYSPTRYLLTKSQSVAPVLKKCSANDGTGVLPIQQVSTYVILVVVKGQKSNPAQSPKAIVLFPTNPHYNPLQLQKSCASSSSLRENRNQEKHD
eukprot:TRINITY_DN8672_c0_g1_i8.p1 TRINITY_DN8672_c0_g1~~TRINITY_DN8672_c0_g1_i8.p1  ORF type:complete len:162 (+),score=6.28 TRINITY_DN8672_c0_g1_i8:68-553(+)